MDWLPLSASLSSRGRPYCTQISTFPQLRVDKGRECQLSLCLSPELSPQSTPSMWLEHGLQSASRNLLDHSPQVHDQCGMIMAFKFTWLPPTSGAPNSHNHSLKVYLQTGSITTSKLAPSRPPSASPKSLNPSIKLYLSTGTIMASRFAPSRLPSPSPQWLDHSLQVHLHIRSITASIVHLQTHSITPSKCLSQLTWLPPWSSHNHGLQVHL